MLKEQFFSILKEFSELTGADLSPDEQTGAVVFIVDDDIVVNLRYMEDSDTVLIFCPVIDFGEFSAPDAGAKSLALLELTDISGGCGSVTLALDSDAHLVLAMDRRSALTISSLDALAGWIEITTEAVRSVRQSLADNFPAAEDA